MPRATCPHCSRPLAGKLLLGKPLPGERRFLPMRAVLVCPFCRGELHGNPHPAESWLFVAYLPFMASFVVMGTRASGSRMFVWLLGASLLMALTATCYVHFKYLRNWPRFSATPKASGIPSSRAGIERGMTMSQPDREIVSTRLFEAPRERMFAAFSDPTRLARWWGPKGFTNTFHEFAMRPGGVWRFVMHGPGGASFENTSLFVEVVPPERIVFQHVSGPPFEMTITLGEEAGGTRLTWRMRFESAAECDKVKALAVAANEQNFDRLEAELATMT